MRSVLLALALGACASAGPAAPDLSTLDEAGYRAALAARFQYPPPSPAPAETDDQRAGQIADAAYFEAFPDFDHAYTPRTRAEAGRLAAQLRTDAENLTHEQFVLRVAEIAALADNGHTAIGDNAYMKNTVRLPLRTYLFADGLHVLRADAANADLLGARIDAIDGKPVADVYRAIRRYEGGTEAHRRVQLIPMLESPALLQAAGVARDRAALTLSGVRADGSSFVRRVAGEARGRSAPVSNTARLLYPVQPGAAMGSLLREDATLPVHLHSRTKLFWLEALPSGGLYIGLAANGDGDDEPIQPFLDAALARVRADHPRFVVLDMRMNGGGDYTTTYAFARALPDAMAGGHTYVLTSGWTFSAAITTTAALKEVGGDRVTIVGEPVGDRLDFWAEGDQFRLPNAFVTVSYATGRHNYAGPCTDRRACFWLNEKFPVRVRTLTPDIAAPLTFAAYAAKRDPAMEAVATAEARRRP